MLQGGEEELPDELENNCSGDDNGKDVLTHPHTCYSFSHCIEGGICEEIKGISLKSIHLNFISLEIDQVVNQAFI